MPPQASQLTGPSAKQLVHLMRRKCPQYVVRTNTYHVSFCASVLATCVRLNTGCCILDAESNLQCLTLQGMPVPFDVSGNEEQ